MTLDTILFGLLLLTLFNAIQLRRLARKVDTMPTKSEFDAKIDALNASVDDLSGDVDELQAEVQTLKDQLASGGLSADEETAVMARLDELQARIDAAAGKQP